MLEERDSDDPNFILELFFPPKFLCRIFLWTFKKFNVLLGEQYSGKTSFSKLSYFDAPCSCTSNPFIHTRSSTVCEKVFCLLLRLDRRQVSGEAESVFF